MQWAIDRYIQTSMDVKVVISAGEFSAGMYIYALIADGNIVDTKRMILTK